jgi:hypothetical protein
MTDLELTEISTPCSGSQPLHGYLVQPSGGRRGSPEATVNTEGWFC